MDGDADGGEGLDAAFFGFGPAAESGVADGRPLAGGFEPVGDAVCWLERVCDDCGALVEEAPPVSCWRCGAAMTPE